jgi:hypothetical protein
MNVNEIYNDIINPSAAKVKEAQTIEEQSALLKKQGLRKQWATEAYSREFFAALRHKFGRLVLECVNGADTMTEMELRLRLKQAQTINNTIEGAYEQLDKVNA